MLILPSIALAKARDFFEEAGSRGSEGTALLAGKEVGGNQHVTRLVVPDQRTGDGEGCWVEVTEAGKFQLLAALGGDERWIARIHSHPGRAYHSSTDDANLVITAEGSWSIVVPYFGLGLRRGLAACAVLRLERGKWRLLKEHEIRESITVVA